MDRFKDMRRPRRSREVVKTDQEGPKKERAVGTKSPGTHTCNPLTLPDVPEGEDSTSYERHNHVLVAEWKKTSRNAMVVDELMSKTFAFRRRAILDDGCDVTALFTKFPFLQDPNQVNNYYLGMSECETLNILACNVFCCKCAIWMTTLKNMKIIVSFFVQLLKELERVTGVDTEEVKKNWMQKWAPKIFEQARIEISSGSAISSACKKIISLGEQSVACMYILQCCIIYTKDSHAFRISFPCYVWS